MLKADYIIIDFDSTFISKESLDMLAESCLFKQENHLEKIEKMLKKDNTFYEVVAEVQNDIFELSKTFSIKTEELYKNNNQWFKKFNAFN